MEKLKVSAARQFSLLKSYWASARTEVRLVIYVASLYTTFLYWGYLQEKLTSTKYSRRLLGADDGSLPTMKWDYPVVLNLSMSLTAAATAYFADYSSRASITIYLFWKASLTSALASPIGYTSLKYIPFPLMILAKSSKPVPVMLIGSIFYKKVYKWFKYGSVLLLCCGIALFTGSKSSSHKSSDDDHPIVHQLFGVLLIFINLCLDGYTNNEQDHIFAAHNATPLQMTKFMNLWQALYLAGYLVLGLLFRGSASELSAALHVIYACPRIKFDIIMFCLCASVGQLLVCGLIQEFGSLVWITVSVTRQLFTVLLSVFIFNHVVNGLQWFGIFLVFAGLMLEIVMLYRTKEKGDLLASTGRTGSAETLRTRGESLDDIERDGGTPRKYRKKKE